MKMFKKLMAVALAGVMALTVLTGCAGAVNKKEYINIMNDMKVLRGDGVETIEQGDSALAKEVLNKVKIFAENHVGKKLDGTVDQLAEEVLSSVRSRDLADIKGIAKDSKDQYTLMWTVMDEYKSKEIQNNQDLINVMKAAQGNSIKLNTASAKSKTATASIATQKIGDTTFLVIVTVQAEK